MAEVRQRVDNRSTRGGAQDLPYRDASNYSRFPDSNRSRMGNDRNFRANRDSRDDRMRSDDRRDDKMRSDDRRDDRMRNDDRRDGRVRNDDRRDDRMRSDDRRDDRMRNDDRRDDRMRGDDRRRYGNPNNIGPSRGPRYHDDSREYYSMRDVSSYTQRPPRRRRNYDEEIVSKTLHVDHKRFYIDLKKNAFGRFIKLVESGSNRGLWNNRGSPSNRVIIPEDLSKKFMAILNEYVDLAENDTVATTSPPEACDRIKSESIENDRKTLIIDLRKNTSGKFLKITEQSPDNYRTHVIMPSEGLETLRDVIRDILSENQDNSNSSANYPSNNNNNNNNTTTTTTTTTTANTNNNANTSNTNNNNNNNNSSNNKNSSSTNNTRNYPRTRAPERNNKLSPLPRPPTEQPATEKSGAADSNTTTTAAAGATSTAPPDATQDHDDDSIDESLPASIEFLSDRKKFYFDTKRNEMGVFLQIVEVSEISRRRRRCVNIPHISWNSCKRALESLCDQLPYEAEPPAAPQTDNQPELHAAAPTDTQPELPAAPSSELLPEAPSTLLYGQTASDDKAEPVSKPETVTNEY